MRNAHDTWIFQRLLPGQQIAVSVDTPTPQIVYVPVSVLPTPTPFDTPVPTPTSAPYEALSVAKIEPISGGPYFDMRWPPDGKQALINKRAVEYILQRDKDTGGGRATNIGDLWLYDPATNSERLLLESVGAFTWSPASSRVAYINPDGGEGIEGALYVLDLDTGATRRLAAADFLGANDYSPQWPATDMIYFVRDGLLRSIRPDGSSEQTLSQFTFSGPYNEETKRALQERESLLILGFRFSPDGKKVAFKTRHENERAIAYRLWIADMDGEHMQLITGQAEGSYYEWSPDGSWLVFDTYRDIDDPVLDDRLPPTQQFWVVSADGGTTLQLHATDNWRILLEPIWSPDSRKIAFIQLEYDQEQTESTTWIANVEPYEKARPLSLHADKEHELSEKATLLSGSSADTGIVGLLTWAPDMESIYGIRTRWNTDSMGYERFAERYVFSLNRHNRNGYFGKIQWRTT